MARNAFTKAIKPIRYHEICSEGQKALEALSAWLDDHEDHDLATVEMGENMPIKALVQNEFEDFVLLWCPAGWQR